MALVALLVCTPVIPQALHAWDVAGCESEGSCCRAAPWFTVDLVNSIILAMILRSAFVLTLMHDAEDSPIHLLELYIQ